MNHSSSRSHCVFRLTVKAMTNSFIKEYRQKNGGLNINLHKLAETHEGTIVTESYLNFIDLAGSERMSAHIRNPEEKYEEEEDTKTVSSRIKEGKHINKSLFFLTQVISLKAEGKSNQYIPFRNSPLTKILRSSLGGNFRTAVVLCINPCLSQADHSLSTLRFGANAKKIQNKVRANIVTNNDNETIRLLIDNYERKIRDMQNQQDDGLSKYEQYISIIDDLKMQRSALLERLEAVNRRFASKLSDDMPEEDIEMFFAKFKHELPHAAGCGLMFTSKDLEMQYREAVDQDMSPHLRQTKADRLKRKFQGEFGSRPSTLNRILDSTTIRRFEIMKRELGQVKQSIQSQRESIVSFCHSYKTLCHFMKTVTNLGQQYLTKLRAIIEEYQDEYMLSRERLIKLQLYEEYKGLSLMSEKDLQTMEDYVKDFMDALKSEKDRRELLATNDNRFPNAVVEGLDGLKLIEEEEQAASMELMKQKLAHFVNFNEGCTNEIEYYRSLCSDFDRQQNVEIKADEIEKLIYEDMTQITTKIKDMDDNFRILDNEIEQNKKKALDKQLKDYKTKFEKLVDVVLSEKRQRDEASPQQFLKQSGLAGDLMVSTVERISVGGENRIKKRSNSITNLEDMGSPVSRVGSQVPAKNQINNRVKGWLTLNALENTNMNYESVLREETLSMSQLRSPQMKKDMDLNGSFSDMKSQNELQNNLCSEFASPLNIGRIGSEQKKNLQKAFDLTFVNGQKSNRSHRERNSYRSIVDTHKNKESKASGKNYIDETHNSQVNLEGNQIFKTVGTPVIVSKDKKLSNSQRRKETQSYRVGDGSFAAFKRSFSNIGRAEVSNLFGSSTDLRLLQNDEMSVNADKKDKYVPFSSTIGMLSSLDMPEPMELLKQRHQSHAVISQNNEVQDPPISTENRSRGIHKKNMSKDRSSAWNSTQYSKATTQLPNKSDLLREDTTRAPSANQKKNDFGNSRPISSKEHGKPSSKITPTMLTKGLLSDNYSKTPDTGMFDFNKRTQSRQGITVASPGKTRPRQASKDPKSIRGKIDSLVSTAKSGGGYRPTSASKKR